MSNPSPEAVAQAEAVEARIADELMRAAQLLLETQVATQPAQTHAIRAALRGAAELRLELTIGPFPSVRLLTVDHDGEEAVLLRSLALALPAQPAAH